MSDSSPALAWAPSSTDDHFADQAEEWNAKYRGSANFRARLGFVGQAITSTLEAMPNARVLDFGGGTGVFGAVASTKASFTVSIDRSVPMLRAGAGDVLAKLLDSAGFVGAQPIFRLAGDEAAVAALRAEFDLVTAIAVLEYVDDCEQLLAVLGGKLRPGGRILATVPNPRSPLRLVSRLLLPLLRRLRPAASGLKGQSYQLVRPSGDRLPWREAARRAGLTVDRVQSVPFGDRSIQRMLHPNLLIGLGKP